jgi:DNA repair exonuclease SbcCD ATPase subunit
MTLSTHGFLAFVDHLTEASVVFDEAIQKAPAPLAIVDREGLAEAQEQLDRLYEKVFEVLEDDENRHPLLEAQVGTTVDMSRTILRRQEKARAEAKDKECQRLQEEKQRLEQDRLRLEHEEHERAEAEERRHLEDEEDERRRLEDEERKRAEAEEERRRRREADRRRREEAELKKERRRAEAAAQANQPLPGQKPTTEQEARMRAQAIVQAMNTLPDVTVSEIINDLLRVDEPLNGHRSQKRALEEAALKWPFRAVIYPGFDNVVSAVVSHLDFFWPTTNDHSA